MNEFMKEALNEAYIGIKNGDGGPFGAIVVKNEKIIGRGHNSVLLNNDPTAHGEVMAIRNACNNIKSFKLDNCILYTTAEPCPMCLGAILWAGIKKVYYGCSCQDSENINFRDTKFYEIIKDGKNDLLIQIEHTECLRLFEDYKNIKDKQNY